MYLCANSIPIANTLVSMANGYKQMLIVLNQLAVLYSILIGRKKTYLSNFWPSNSAAGEWSKAGHKDLNLTIPLKASGRFRTQGERRQNEAANTKEWPYLIQRRCYVFI